MLLSCSSWPNPSPLQHLDRVVFGPCRMLCLYLTQPLTVDEKSKLTYSYAFREFTSEGAGDDGLMTPERQALVDSINEIKQDIAQANIIGAEMCTTLTFRIQVGDGGVFVEKCLPP